MATERSPGRGPYAKSALVRQRAIEASLEVFTSAGYHGATMADVARKAGMSHTGLLHHFPSKLDLLVAVLAYGDAESREHLAAHDVLTETADPLEVLRELTQALDRRDASTGLVELDAVIAGEATAPDHPAHQYLAERFSMSRAFYERLFEALRRDGRLRSDADPAMLATTTIALIQGIRVQWLYDRSGVDTVEAVSVFLRSVVPDLDR